MKHFTFLVAILSLSFTTNATLTSLTYPSYVVSGIEFSIELEAKNVYNDSTIGTMAITLPKEIVITNFYPDSLSIYRPPSKVARFSKEDARWVMIDSSKWSPIENLHIEVYSNSWLVGEYEKISLTMLQTSATPVDFKVRATFGSEPKYISHNFPLDGSPDQTGLPALDGRIQVLPRSMLETPFNSDEIRDWYGIYVFEEHIEGSPPWIHRLDIEEADDFAIARLQGDGRMLEEDLICRAIEFDGILHLVLLQDRIRPLESRFIESQVVLSLEKAPDGQTLTHWSAYSAALPNKDSGFTYFQRVGIETQENRNQLDTDIQEDTKPDTRNIGGSQLNEESSKKELDTENAPDIEHSANSEEGENSHKIEIDIKKFLYILVFFSVLFGVVCTYFIVRLIIDVAILLLIAVATIFLVENSGELGAIGSIAVGLIAGVVIGLVTIPLLPFSRLFRPRSGSRGWLPSFFMFGNVASSNPEEETENSEE